MNSGTLPPKARLDAVHVAVAAVNGMDYLLTWNLRHLANAALRGKIEAVCRDAGTVPPIICTPGRTHGDEVMTRRDPIVEEVRKHREAIAREHGNDLDAIVAAFQRQDASDDRATVSFPPKRLVDRRLRPKPKSRRPNTRLHRTAPYAWTLPPGFPPPVVPADNPMSAAKVELGRRLFYDTRLSTNRTQSCAICHRIPAIAHRRRAAQ